METKTATMIDTEFLIVGAGPAGASLAGFLGQNGLVYSRVLLGQDGLIA